MFLIQHDLGKALSGNSGAEGGNYCLDDYFNLVKPHLEAEGYKTINTELSPEGGNIFHIPEDKSVNRPKAILVGSHSITTSLENFLELLINSEPEALAKEAEGTKKAEKADLKVGSILHLAIKKKYKKSIPTQNIAKLYRKHLNHILNKFAKAHGVKTEHIIIIPQTEFHIDHEMLPLFPDPIILWKKTGKETKEQRLLINEAIIKMETLGIKCERVTYNEHDEDDHKHSFFNAIRIENNLLTLHDYSAVISNSNEETLMNVLERPIPPHYLKKTDTFLKLIQKYAPHLRVVFTHPQLVPLSGGGLRCLTADIHPPTALAPNP